MSDIKSKHSTDELLFTTVNLLKQISERIVVVDDHLRRLDSELVMHIRTDQIENKVISENLAELKKDVSTIGPIVLTMRQEVDRLIQEYSEKKIKESKKWDSLFNMKLEVLKTVLTKVLTIIGIGFSLWILLILGLPKEYIEKIIPNFMISSENDITNNENE